MIMKICRNGLILLVGLCVSGTNAFVATSIGGSTHELATVRVSTSLHAKTSPASSSTKQSGVSYAEQSRMFRRNVYSHDDWVSHRAPDRFIRNIKSITGSGVYKNIANEVSATTAVALVICGYNMLVGEYTDLSGENHAGVLANTFLPLIGFPLAPFTLSSPSLGLLLGKTDKTLFYVVAWIASKTLTHVCLSLSSFSYKHLLPTLG